jgi:hypothetical protein
MRIRLAIPDRYVSAPVLDAALEATTRAAQAQMSAGDAPTFTDLLRSGVRWQPEHFADGEHFDLPETIGERGWGDCDDLSSALAAELRATGQDPGAVARVIRSGPDRWHAIVQLSDGRTLDPSVMAGMKSRNSIKGAVGRPMAEVGESAIAIAPYHGEYWVRTDVPWGPGHLSSINHSKSLEHAFDRSIVGALATGRFLDWSHAADRTRLGELYEQAIAHDMEKDGTPWENRNGLWLARF